MNKNRSFALRLALALAGLVATSALALGCTQTERVVKGDSTISEIDRNPENYIGRTVELTGNIEEVFSANAFEIESERLLDDELMVVIPEDVDFDGFLAENEQVWLSGRVEQLDQRELAEYAGTPDYAPVSYSGMRTVIIVDEIRMITIR